MRVESRYYELRLTVTQPASGARSNVAPTPGSRGGMIGCQDVNGSAKSDEYNAIGLITAKEKD